jgi:hypothetical protein
MQGILTPGIPSSRIALVTGAVKYGIGRTLERHRYALMPVEGYEFRGVALVQSRTYLCSKA